MSDQPHRSRNSMNWRTPHQAITEARRQPGWVEFHRECGAAGLFYDDFEANSGGGYASSKFSCVTYRLDGHRPVHVSRGRGNSVAECMLNAFVNAQNAGFPISGEIRDRYLAAGRPVESTPAPAINLEDLLG